MSRAQTVIDNWMKLRDVIEATKLSRTTIYRRIGQGTFPKPVVITEACVRWRQSDIAAWMGQFEQKAG